MEFRYDQNHILGVQHQSLECNDIYCVCLCYQITKFSTDSESGCIIGNTNTTSDATVSYAGKDFDVPAWSISLLPDCQTEVYNTAKVNTQTTIRVKKSNDVDEDPAPLSWTWTPEDIDHSVRQLKKGDFAANMLIDQKAATSDSSDYLWYRTE